PLLVDDVYYILVVIILSDTMIDFDEKELILANPILANSMIDFDQRYKKKEMPHSDKNGRRRLL
ncbi:22754_t:CDS:2, partial [Rhizophagus irregularis]